MPNPEPSTRSPAGRRGAHLAGGGRGGTFPFPTRTYLPSSTLFRHHLHPFPIHLHLTKDRDGGGRTACADEKQPRNPLQPFYFLPPHSGCKATPPLLPLMSLVQGIQYFKKKMFLIAFKHKSLPRSLPPLTFTKAIGVVVPSISNRITVTSAGTDSTTISLPDATTGIGLLVGRAEGGAHCAPSTVLGFRQPRKDLPLGNRVRSGTRGTEPPPRP